MPFLPLVSLVLAGHAFVLPADSTRADADVRDVAMRHATEVRRCYETQGLRLNPSLRGTVELSVTVSPTGRVDSATVTASQLSGAGKKEVEACVVAVARNWRFERGPYATETIVYPFDLARDQRTREVVQRS